ncbi:hypothetical protein I3843_01G096400 [Carya illinoinensis]|nr:hypothetical protein I3843_01G096400 [Carya illinoinensis]
MVLEMDHLGFQGSSPAMTRALIVANQLNPMLRALALASSKPMPNAKLDDFTKNMLHWISQTQKWVTLTYSKCIGSFIYEVILCTHLHIILVYFIYLPVTFRFPLSPFPPRVFSPHFSHFHFSQSLRLYTSNLRSHSILQRQEQSGSTRSSSPKEAGLFSLPLSLFLSFLRFF